ncbi:MAG TPA: ANTAR domain-containing protein [Acidimicrobiales bacterium]|jgi:hypothetical protein|nr:ANTAR domain-containing protein [Acidimicrobiales bacterium]
MGDLFDLEPAGSFARMARALLAEPDLASALERVVGLAVATIDGCEHASVSVVRARHSTVRVASSETATRLEALQEEVGEGPTRDAATETFVVADDLRSDGRWHRFSARASASGDVRCIAAFRLFVEERRAVRADGRASVGSDERTIGTLTVSAGRAAALTKESVSIGLLLATHGALVLAAKLRQEQLEEALRSRDVIGQAKGILMAREGITADQAFDRLRRASQRLNLKLRDIADQVAFTGLAP